AAIRTEVASRKEAGRPSPPITDVFEGLRAQAEFRFNEENITSWCGRLSEMQQSQAWLLAHYLEAALRATKRRTARHPAGVIQIHPAVKLLTGDAGLTASKAADIVKRLLGPLEGELRGDLREALLIAVRLRPRSPKAPSEPS